MSEQLTHLSLELPMKTVSELNRRDHWRTVANRRAGQRYEVCIEWRKALGVKKIALPCRVTLTRVGARELDSDNLASALKSCRDEIAALLGVDDSPSSPAQFEYKQEAKGKRQYGVKIEVQSF